MRVISTVNRRPTTYCTKWDDPPTKPLFQQQKKTGTFFES